MSSHKEAPILIKKASGEVEAFERKKLAESLRRAGADETSVTEITEAIVDWLKDGVTTKRIYSHAYSLLSKQKTAASARYKVKYALMQLGSSGYPFEHFVGELFKKQGYDVQVGQILQGCSITHEMDVIATSDHVQHLMECKHSKIQGRYVSIQVPLYVHSRVNDIVNKRLGDEAYTGITFTTWVVTNTRFSSDSMEYAKYYGLNLLSWDYPPGKGIKDLIEQEHLYPITVLESLTVKNKDYLIDHGVITCNELLDRIEVIEILDLSDKRRTALKKELSALVQYTNAQR